MSVVVFEARVFRGDADAEEQLGARIAEDECDLQATTAQETCAREKEQLNALEEADPWTKLEDIFAQRPSVGFVLIDRLSRLAPFGYKATRKAGSRRDEERKQVEVTKSDAPMWAALLTIGFEALAPLAKYLAENEPDLLSPTKTVTLELTDDAQLATYLDALLVAFLVGSWVEFLNGAPAAVSKAKSAAEKGSLNARVAFLQMVLDSFVDADWNIILYLSVLLPVSLRRSETIDEWRKSDSAARAT